MPKKPAPIESLELFIDPGPRLAEPIPKGLTLRKRRTALRLQKIALGQHPLLGIPLHPLASREIDRSRAPRPFTCGTCAHLVPLRNTAKPKLDCELSMSTGTAKRYEPACVQYRQRGVVATTSNEPTT